MTQTPNYDLGAMRKVALDATWKAKAAMQAYIIPSDKNPPDVGQLMANAGYMARLYSEALHNASRGR